MNFVGGAAQQFGYLLDTVPGLQDALNKPPADELAAQSQCKMLMNASVLHSYLDSTYRWRCARGRRACTSVTQCVSDFLPPPPPRRPLTHSNQSIFFTLRPHCLYVASFRCTDSAARALGGSFDVGFVNLNPGGLFAREFSVDVQGELQAFIAALLIALPSALGASVCACRHRCRSFARPAAGVAASLLPMSVGLALWIAGKAALANTGALNTSLMAAGDVLYNVGITAFSLSLLLVGGGGGSLGAYRLHARDLVGSISLVVIMAAAYVGVFVWPSLVGSPADVHVLTDSTPGIVVIAARAAMLPWFLSVTVPRATSEDVTRMQRLYMGQLATIGALWFVILPIVVVLPAALPEWFAHRAATITQVLLTSLIGALFLFLHYPPRVHLAFSKPDPTWDPTVIAERMARYGLGDTRINPALLETVMVGPYKPAGVSALSSAPARTPLKPLLAGGRGAPKGEEEDRKPEWAGPDARPGTRPSAASRSGRVSPVPVLVPESPAAVPKKVSAKGTSSKAKRYFGTSDGTKAAAGGGGGGGGPREEGGVETDRCAAGPAGGTCGAWVYGV